ncbi:MAG TPA: trehalose-phosphatase [Thermohalobaculum sp.]|nr:trehalose-phosphatase [Thermohalobaculum sp.]
MCEPISAFDTGRLRPEALAVLLDFDGTLVAIADQPGGVVLKQHTVRTLARLETLLGGAVAIVSGRSIEDIDRIFAPRRPAVAGIHGLERRDGGGRRHGGDYDRAALDAIATRLGDAIADRPGLVLERKPGSVALHYRQCPELEAFCLEQARDIAARHPDARLLSGKMVVEIKLGARTKADAVTDFMAEPPFAGRTPLYAGDDVTDEDAFRAVAGLGGISIKIGCGETVALYCVPDTEAFLDWLGDLSEGLAAGRAPAHGEGPRP